MNFAAWTVCSVLLKTDCCHCPMWLLYILFGHIPIAPQPHAAVQTQSEKWHTASTNTHNYDYQLFWRLNDQFWWLHFMDLPKTSSVLYFQKKKKPTQVDNAVLFPIYLSHFPLSWNKSRNPGPISHSLIDLLQIILFKKNLNILHL